MKYILIIFLVVFFCSNQSVCQSIGSEFTYECLGEGSTPDTRLYKVEFKRYEDCEAIPLASDYSSIVYNNGEIVFVFSGLHLDSTEQVINPEFPCQILPDSICFAVGYYKNVLELPVSDHSYFYAFMDCCRPDEVANLDESTYGWGIGSFIEITPTAQGSCNSSPEFTNFFPTTICKDEIFQTIIQAEDPDGDQLVYEFYNPFDWNASLDTINEPPQLNGFIPPPYPLLQYDFPQYNFNYPFGASAFHELNPNTGELKIIPDENGLYVVGIRVSEYRNGELLGSVNRDFLVKVRNCIPQVSANIIADTVDANGNFIINLCSENTLQIENTSTTENYINNYHWNFTVDGESYTTSEWNPILNFTTSGNNLGQLILNPDELCSDTADIIINFTKSINADFEISYDTCIGGPVNFLNTSNLDFGVLNSTWYLDDTISYPFNSPNHLFKNPGAHWTKLIVENEFGCKDSISQSFNWQPAPPVILIAPDAEEGCSPLDVLIENRSSPIDSTYQIIWNMGDGATSDEIHPDYRFDDPGIYSVCVEITSPLGCTIDTIFPDLIRVEPGPEAIFSFSPETISTLNSEVFFENESDRNIGSLWSVNQDTFYNENITYDFDTAGIYQVRLTVEDVYGCLDTKEISLEVEEFFTYFLPNAFTPNGDGHNEEFIGVGIFSGLKNFKMTIFDRWGSEVFSTIDPGIGWNGYGKSNEPMPAAVYQCFVQFMDHNGQFKEVIQSFVLVR